MEHEPWVPPAYKADKHPPKIAICGFSHHSDEGDDAAITNRVVTRVVETAARYRFFTSIAQAFGNSVPNFFNNVMFFNFLPTSVGSGDDRYGAGSPDQIRQGRARALRLITEHQPDVIFVFSSKAWANFPPTNEWRGQQPLPSGASWGVYKFAHHETVAIGCRHPQGASAAFLKEVVSVGLELPLDRVSAAGK